MEISVFSIQKSRADSFENELAQYVKMSAKFANLHDRVIFTDRIAKAQNAGRDEALRAYDEAYEPYLKGFCVVLDERGEQPTSEQFAKIFDQGSQINFFIGGAYGLSDKFKSRANKIISLSKMTLAHKIAKLVLFEQIFRGLCIKANHPYHK